MFVSLTRVCVVYVVKEVTSFPGAQSINGRGTKYNVHSSSTEQPEKKLLVGLLAHVETGTNS